LASWRASAGRGGEGWREFLPGLKRFGAVLAGAQHETASMYACAAGGLRGRFDVASEERASGLV